VAVMIHGYFNYERPFRRQQALQRRMTIEERMERSLSTLPTHLVIDGRAMDSKSFAYLQGYVDGLLRRPPDARSYQEQRPLFARSENTQRGGGGTYGALGALPKSRVTEIE